MEENNTLTVREIFDAINQTRTEMEYVNDALSKLEAVKSAGPEDIGAQAKAQAIAEVVKCRETTVQKLIAFYEKLYEDIRPRNTLKDRALELADKAMQSGKDEEAVSGLFDAIRHI